ncbi:MAG: hypothetical protein HRF51_04340 [bacterium]
METDWRRAVGDIPFFAERFLHLELHSGQRRWLERSDRMENLLVTGNRWGKSFVSAVKIVHHALLRIRDLKYDRALRYRIVTASLTLDQARIIFDTVARLFQEQFIIKNLIRRMVVTPYPRLYLGNGAIIEARSTQRRGEYLLGNDYDYFVYDEVAYDDDAEYVVNNVIKMRLADRMGKLDLVSTPNGKNWFYRKMLELKERRDDGYVQGGDSRENSFISGEYLRMQTKYLSDHRVAQNIMGQFVDSGAEIIPGKYIDAALISDDKGDKSSSDGKESFYITGWDLARKKTATVGITVQVRDGIATVVDLARIRKWDWNIILEQIRKQQKKYPGRILVDATGLGDVVVSQISELNPTAIIMTPKTKAELLTNLELFHSMEKIRYHRWELPDSTGADSGSGRVWSLEDELREARWDSAETGDALVALALALWPLHEREVPMIKPRVGKG